MDFLTAKQYADMLGVTPRRVQDMCRQGKIKGVVRHGREWLIPVSESKESNEQNNTQENRNKSESLSNMHIGMFDLYKKAGSAREMLDSVVHNEVERDLFASQLAFYQGDYKKAISLALKHFDEKDTDVNLRIAVGLQLTHASLYGGDFKLWSKGFNHIRSSAVPTDEGERCKLEFWTATAASTASDEELFPDWFCRGDFTRLPPYYYPVASYSYVKHLYHECGRIKEKEKIFELLRAMPYTIEPLISYSAAFGCVIVEIYLRLVCALAYHLSGNDSLAIPHLDRAIELAIPDMLVTPLAEYRRRFGFLMDDRLALKSSEALAEVKNASKALVEGWTAIHNEMLGKRVASHLSIREWQAARLAAYGLSNKDVAEIMGVTVNAVKQALRLAMDKTGAQNRDELHLYI